MKTELWEHLSKPYDEPRKLSPERLRWKAMQVDLPAAHELDSLVMSDFDEVHFGIGWWRDDLEAPKRILLADYLIAALRSVSINLCEAALHHHELAEWVDREPGWRAHHHISGSMRIERPTPVSVAGDLATAMVDMHSAGYFRAIASSLDCFATCATIVLALPKQPYHMTYEKLLQYVENLEKIAPVVGPPEIRLAWLRRVIEMEKQSADGEWGKWLSQARHGYVHKSRRLLYCMPMRRSQLFLDRFNGVVSCRIGHFMPSQPHLTEIQDRREAQYVPVLTEELTQTTRLGLRAVVEYLQSGMALLLEVWSQRRAEQINIKQPDCQWEKVTGPDRIDFRGFAPGTVPYKPDAFTADDEYMRRLKASAVLDHQRHMWDQWVSGTQATTSSVVQP